MNPMNWNFAIESVCYLQAWPLRVTPTSGYAHIKLRPLQVVPTSGNAQFKLRPHQVTVTPTSSLLTSGFAHFKLLTFFYF